MINPEDKGNPAIPVMQLITQLEGKVREKNKIIEGLEDERDYYRRKWLFTEIVWGKWSSVVFVGLGMIVGSAIIWMVIK